MRVKILGIPVDRVDMKTAVARINSFIRNGKPHHVITLNAEILYRARTDSSLKNVIDQAHLITPDGAGVVWAARRLGAPLPERVTGIDLLQEVARRAARKRWNLFLYGGKPGVAQESARVLQARFPGLRVSGTAHGYLSPPEEKELLAGLRRNPPHILLVALGAPRQEFWIREHLDDLRIPVCIGVGGSLDVISGKVKRAPLFWRRMGLEWLYRLLRQPQRAGRMLVLPRFAWAVLREGRHLAR